LWFTLAMKREMDHTASTASERRFSDYVTGLSRVLGHADRVEPLKAYCTGLLLPGARKSVEPMAARLAPARVQAAHQSLHHFVAKAGWSDAALLACVRTQVLPVIEAQEPISAWIVDDTGFPKKGRHSVGVAHQYCGQVGKIDNCQVAVTLSVANTQASLPVAYRLYLPQDWADDPERRARTGVPETIAFQTKPEIALDQIRAAQAEGITPGVVLADAGYGVDTAFRTALTERGLPYILGIVPTTSLWPPGLAPLPPEPWSGQGRPPTLLRRTPDHKPLPADELALTLPAQAWRTLTWREGTNATLSSRFAAVRVHPAHRDTKRRQPHPQEWLLIEWPRTEPAPTRYWLSTLPPQTPLSLLVRQAKLRWRIERDDRELKQELGLGHYEGRGWRGFHHHASLCIAAYGFLVCERGRFPPSDLTTGVLVQASPLPQVPRPRGAPDPTRAARA